MSRSKSLSSMIQDDLITSKVGGACWEKNEKFDEELATHWGCIRRPKAIGHFYYGSHNQASLTEYEGAEFINKSLFVQAMSGVGVTATVVGAYLIKELKLPLVAVFESPQMPAMCSIHSYQSTPPIRIHGNKDVCVAVGDLPLSATKSSPLIWQIVKAFCDFARRHRCRHTVTVEGLPIKNQLEKEIKEIAKKEGLEIQQGDDDEEEEDYEENEIEDLGEEPEAEAEKDEDDERAAVHLQSPTDPESESAEKTEEKDPYATVRYVSCCDRLAKKLFEMGHRPIKTGEILGITGAMLALCPSLPCDDPPLTAILAPDPVKLIDQRGALMAVKLLRELFDLKLDTTTLEKESERLAEKTNLIMSNIKEQIYSQLKQMKPGPPPPNMYL